MQPRLTYGTNHDLGAMEYASGPYLLFLFFGPPTLPGVSEMQHYVQKLVDLKYCKRKGTYMPDEALRVWPALQLLEPTIDCALGPSLVGAQTIAFSFKYVQCVPSLTF